MTWYKVSKDEITKDMLKHFEKRTKMHIDLVRKYCRKIYEYDKDKFIGIIKRGEIHDQSKYEDPEIIPYIFISWQYKCEDDAKDFYCSSDIKEQMNLATEHHVKNNRHHPEYHSNTEVDIINREDRDKPPKKKINAKNMTDLDIAEMVADWCAMSEEKNSHPKDWADKNINKRWEFTEDQKDLIYELIDSIF